MQKPLPLKDLMWRSRPAYVPNTVLGAKYIWVTMQSGPNTSSVLTLPFHLYVILSFPFVPGLKNHADMHIEAAMCHTMACPLCCAVSIYGLGNAWEIQDLALVLLNGSVALYLVQLIKPSYSIPCSSQI